MFRLASFCWPTRLTKKNTELFFSAGKLTHTLCGTGESSWSKKMEERKREKKTRQEMWTLKRRRN